MMRTFSIGLIAVVSVLRRCRGEAQQLSAACERRLFAGSKFTVCAFDATQDELRLTDRYRRLTALEKTLGGETSRVRFAMNAGMFDASGGAIGLYVEAG